MYALTGEPRPRVRNGTLLNAACLDALATDPQAIAAAHPRQGGVAHV